LNRIWKTNHRRFDEIRVPAWPGENDGPTHFAPGPVPDFRRFQEIGTWRVRDRLAHAVKRAMRKPVVVLAYDAPYDHAFARSKHVDAVGMQPDYAHRRPGFPLGFYPVAASAVGKKLLFTELDLRLAGEGWPAGEIARAWVSVPETVPEMRSSHRKTAGVSLAAGYGNWYYDMGQYFNRPDVHAEIGAVHRIHERLMQTPVSGFRPEVCVVRTENDHAYLRPREAVLPYDEVNFHPAALELAASGVPHERHYLSDILRRPDLQKFKVYVFHQNAFLSDAERAGIIEKLRNRNRTLVWVYNSGYIGEAGKSVEAMSALAGITLATDEAGVRRQMQIRMPDVPPFCGGAEMFFRVLGRTTGVQHFWVNDRTATPLARYAETGQVAMARKNHPGWTSVFVGAPKGLSGHALHRIAREAGAYVAGPPGCQVNLSGEFASVHALRTGTYTLILPPGRSRILDADTGRVLAQNIRAYTFPAEAQGTYWFLFE
jgi:hypothetical protein